MSAAPSFVSRKPFGHNERKADKPVRPTVEIMLRDKNGERIYPSQYIFSTLDKVEGTMTVISPTDIRFDELDIALLGM